MMDSIYDIRRTFVRELQRARHMDVLPPTVEIIGARFYATEPTIFGKVNLDYVRREIEWFESQSLSIHAMEEPIPKIWVEISSPSGGFINSNYGWCIWSQENGSQYDWCLEELKRNPSTRRACMIYQRPSMQVDYCRAGMSDFLCTDAVHVLIREGRLYYIVYMRSNDAVFGYKADYAWHEYVKKKLIEDLSGHWDKGPLSSEPIMWHAASLHVYERHYKRIDQWMKSEGLVIGTRTTDEV